MTPCRVVRRRRFFFFAKNDKRDNERISCYDLPSPTHLVGPTGQTDGNTYMVLQSRPNTHRAMDMQQQQQHTAECCRLQIRPVLMIVSVGY